MSLEPTEFPDRYVAEFLDLAQSANIYFDLVNDRLTMRAVNPVWEMWKPFRHLLDEIGSKRIETYLRTGQTSALEQMSPWPKASTAIQ